MVREATHELVAVEDDLAMSRYATDSSSSAIEPEQRRTASDKLAYHRNLREALLKLVSRPRTSPLLQPSRCRASRFLALSTLRCSSSHATTTIAWCRGAARPGAREGSGTPLSRRRGPRTRSPPQEF